MIFSFISSRPCVRSVRFVEMQRFLKMVKMLCAIYISTPDSKLAIRLCCWRRLIRMSGRKKIIVSHIEFHVVDEWINFERWYNVVLSHAITEHSGRMFVCVCGKQLLTIARWPLNMLMSGNLWTRVCILNIQH